MGVRRSPTTSAEYIHAFGFDQGWKKFGKKFRIKIRNELIRINSKNQIFLSFFFWKKFELSFFEGIIFEKNSIEWKNSELKFGLN